MNDITTMTINRAIDVYDIRLDESGKDIKVLESDKRGYNQAWVDEYKHEIITEIKRVERDGLWKPLDIRMMDVYRAVEVYRIRLDEDGHDIEVGMRMAAGYDQTWVDEHKNEIMSYLRRRRRDDRQYSLMDRLDGLDEITSMQEIYDDESAQRQRAIYGDGSETPMDRTVTFDQIREALDAHPMVRLWLLADEKSKSSNPEIAGLGDDVKCDILDGLDYEQVVSRRDLAEKEYIARHQWD